MSKFNILEQGYKAIAIAILTAIVISIFFDGLIVTIFILVVLFVVFIYRDTQRAIFINKNAILSPIDGIIKAIDYVDGKQKIYCEVNLTDEKVLRAPVDGKMKLKSMIKGLSLSDDSYKATQLNTQANLKFPHLKVKLLAGVCNNNILCESKKKNVTQGEKIGLFCGGTVILEPEENLKLFIKIGDNITAGQTIIGKYK